MVAGLMSGFRLKGIQIALPVLVWTLSPIAFGQALPDPTRPPPELSNGSTLKGQTVSPVKSGLQTVIISPQRRAAIINGKTVEVGEKYGNAKLIEVTERGVVLQGTRGKQVLALFPDVHFKIKEGVSPLPIDTIQPVRPKMKPTQQTIKPGQQTIKKDKSDNIAVQPATPGEAK